MESTSFEIGVGLPIVTPVLEAPARPRSETWRDQFPVLANDRVTLRELRPSDARVLAGLLTTEEVTRFISPPPSDLTAFARFIEWAHTERVAGRCACFAVVPAGTDTPVGIVQVRTLDPGFSIAEWGGCLGSEYWGTGLFMSAARLLIDFAFDVLGAHRLEARAAVGNGRANGAARKLGGVQEGVLRRSLLCRERYHDQILWSILAEDWRRARTERRPMVH
jgi:RimJ/RimL family protein N-acetyltransferase